MSIREVYPGTAVEPGAEYVELQMWNAGQNLVGGHTLSHLRRRRHRQPTTVLPSDVPNGANQSTVLIATPEAEAEFGIVADAPLSPSDQLDPAGGAVCWEERRLRRLGRVHRPAALACPRSESRQPGFSGRGPGRAWPCAARSHQAAPPCSSPPTTEDSDDSATDFAAVEPEPAPQLGRPDRAAPAKNPRAAAGQGGSRWQTRPRPLLKRSAAAQDPRPHPDLPLRRRRAGATFQCKLDGKPFKPCRSPFTTKRLSLGRHVFKVRARDDSGELDPTPASCRFKVIAKSLTRALADVEAFAGEAADVVA